jgi:hypothetical protein
MQKSSVGQEPGNSPGLPPPYLVAIQFPGKKLLDEMCRVTAFPIMEVSAADSDFTNPALDAQRAQLWMLFPRQKQSPANNQAYTHPFPQRQTFSEKKHRDDDRHNDAKLVNRGDPRHFAKLKCAKIT